MKKSKPTQIVLSHEKTYRILKEDKITFWSVRHESFFSEKRGSTVVTYLFY